MQNTKMGRNKKRPDKKIVLTHTNKQKEDRQIFRREMMITKQRRFLSKNK
jgi:hypothetical protein